MTTQRAIDVNNNNANKIVSIITTLLNELFFVDIEEFLFSYELFNFVVHNHSDKKNEYTHIIAKNSS